MREMRVTELKALLDGDGPKPLMLDVREPWEYRLCRIEGTRLVPMREIPDAARELDPEKEILVVCHHGIRSAWVCRYLEGQGFSQVINLEGGMAAWARDVDPATVTY